MRLSLRHRYVVRHERSAQGGDFWWTYIRREDGQWSASIRTRTRWGGARKAERAAREHELQELKPFDPLAPYTIGGETY